MRGDYRYRSRGWRGRRRGATRVPVYRPPRRTRAVHTQDMLALSTAAFVVLLVIWQVTQLRVSALNEAGQGTAGPQAVNIAAHLPKTLSRDLPKYVRDLAWMDPRQPPMQRADELLGRMTLDDKISMMHGVPQSAYGGVIPAVPRLGIPALKLDDGPAGVGNYTTGATQLPAPIAAAATWDTNLMRQYGSVIGAEHWAKGANVDLGPTVNIIRDPRWGRAFEALGEDPYLSGKMAASEITGIQSRGVLAQVKHFAVYNQETGRNTPADNAVIDERTLEEIYLPQFQAAVDAGVASTMCSYSTINGVPACQNQYLIHSILDRQFGFQGFVTTDWMALHAGSPAANAGIDMEMPRPQFFSTALRQAVRARAVPMTTVNNSVRRILYEMFRFGLFDRRQTGTPSTVATTPAHAAVAREVAADSAVLLKNAGGILPLRTARLRCVAVIGESAAAQPMTAGGGSAFVVPSGMSTPLAAIQRRAGNRVGVRYAQGPTPEGALPAIPRSSFSPPSGRGTGLLGSYWPNTGMAGRPVLSRIDRKLDFHFYGDSPGPGIGATQWSARWEGTINAPSLGTYTFALSSEDGSRLYIDGRLVIDNWLGHGRSTAVRYDYLQPGRHSIRVDYLHGRGDSSITLGWLPPGAPSLIQRAATLAGQCSAAVVFVRDYEIEGKDRASLMLPDLQNELIWAVASANPHTIVVLNTGDPVLMPWVNRVAGLIEAWYPGQEDGAAIASVLFGDVNPSGRLPVTFPASATDLPASSPRQWPGVNGKVLYSEGLDVGYRWYDARHITPLFPFGYGLSYTTFAFSRLSISPHILSPGGTVTVRATVKNTGARAGADVVQLYVGDPPSAAEPPQQLKAFQKVFLKPHQQRRVSFVLGNSALAHWDDTSHAWAVSSGVYRVALGSSSRDILLRGTVTVPATATAGNALARRG